MVDEPGDNKFESTRRYALEALKLVKPELLTRSVVDAVAVRVRDEKWDVLRKAGLEVFQKAAQPADLTAHALLIAERLDKEGWDCVKLEAINAMERFEQAVLVPHAAALARIAANESWDWVRQRAIEVIGLLPVDVIRRDCLVAVRKCVNDDSAGVRKAARDVAAAST